MNESEIKTGPHDPPASPELEAVIELHRKFDRLMKIATDCFEALQEVPILRERIKSLEERVSILERASKCPACFSRDTEPSPAP